MLVGAPAHGAPRRVLVQVGVGAVADEQRDEVGGGDVLVERRPDRGLLGGMLALPTTEWLESGMAERPGWADGGDAIGEVRHVFTHFELRLTVKRLTLADAPSGFEWMSADEAGEAFPSVFRKALKLAR